MWKGVRARGPSANIFQVYFRQDNNRPPSSSLACWLHWYRLCLRLASCTCLWMAIPFVQWFVPMPVRVSSTRSLLSQQTWTNDVPGWMFDGTNTSFSVLEDLCAISCCAIPASTFCICVADRPCPKRFRSDTTFALPEMCFMARGSPTCLAVFMRPRVTQWIMSCATERTWQQSDSEASSTFSCRERPCDVLSPRRSHARKLKSGVGTWALAAWSLISVG